MFSAFVRTPNDPIEGANPFPIKSYDVQIDETGKKVFVESEPVAFSRSQDFDVLNNAIYRNGSAPQYRLSADLVDVDSKLSDVLD